MRECADGQKQSEYMMKEESTSPTVTTEAIFMTSVIDAKENREIAVVDLLRAFLHTKNDHDVIMFMKGRLVELMSLIAPQTYRKYVTVETGQKVLYVKVQKALYGMLKSALLFFKKLRAVLVSLGLEVNLYDPCIANKIIKGHQLTTIFHVNDLNISHQNGWEITKIIKWQ